MNAGHLGFFNTSVSRTHVGFQFSTHESAGGNVAPLSAFEAADLRIYRAADGAAFSATQRSSANGITMTSPFDSQVGCHDVDIDLTDNTDSGFYAAGYRYAVHLAPDSETIDGQTITSMPLAMFEIGDPIYNALHVATFAQPGQETPAATTTLGVMLRYLYKMLRNKKTQTATEGKLYADDASTVDQKWTTADDGSTTTIGEIATGP